MTTEQICGVPSCTKVAIYPTGAIDKLACIEHWEEFEKWQIERGL